MGNRRSDAGEQPVATPDDFRKPQSAALRCRGRSPAPTIAYAKRPLGYVSFQVKDHLSPENQSGCF